VCASERILKISQYLAKKYGQKVWWHVFLTRGVVVMQNFLEFHKLTQILSKFAAEKQVPADFGTN